MRLQKILATSSLGVCAAAVVHMFLFMNWEYTHSELHQPAVWDVSRLLAVHGVRRQGGLNRLNGASATRLLRGVLEQDLPSSFIFVRSLALCTPAYVFLVRRLRLETQLAAVCLEVDPSLACLVLRRVLKQDPSLLHPLLAQLLPQRHQFIISSSFSSTSCLQTSSSDVPTASIPSEGSVSSRQSTMHPIVRLLYEFSDNKTNFTASMWPYSSPSHARPHIATPVVALPRSPSSSRLMTKLDQVLQQDSETLRTITGKAMLGGDKPSIASCIEQQQDRQSHATDGQEIEGKKQKRDQDTTKATRQTFSETLLTSPQGTAWWRLFERLCHRADRQQAGTDNGTKRVRTTRRMVPVDSDASPVMPAVIEVRPGDVLEAALYQSLLVLLFRARMSFTDGTQTAHMTPRDRAVSRGIIHNVHTDTQGKSLSSGDIVVEAWTDEQELCYWMSWLRWYDLAVCVFTLLPDTARYVAFKSFHAAHRSCSGADPFGWEHVSRWVQTRLKKTQQHSTPFTVTGLNGHIFWLPDDKVDNISII